jgi:hypothetical protein
VTDPRPTDPAAADSLTDDLAATIVATRRAERDLFGALDDEALQRPIREGDWSPKDHQAHLTAWKARQADRFTAVREGRELAPGLAREEEDALNEELRAARAAWSWEDVVAEADSTAERLGGEIRQSDPAAIRASGRLIGGTFGNGVLHALTHLRWLREAGVPLDRARLDEFAAEAESLVGAASLPDGDRAAGLYDLACFRALTGSADAARELLRHAFRLRPDLVAFGRTDPDLASLRDELDALGAR